MPNHDRFECQTVIDSDAILHLGLPGTAHQDAILGFDALRVFVPAEAFGELVRELTERVATGGLANAMEALRTLYGDL